MKKKLGNEYKTISIWDIVMIVVAIFAVIGLVIFLYFIQKQQDAEREQLGLESEKQYFEQQQEIEATNAKYRVLINEVARDGQIELVNIGNTDVSLDGFCLIINGKKQISFSENDVIKRNSLFTVTEQQDYLWNGTDVITLINADSEVLDTMLLPVLSIGKSYARIDDGGDEFSVMDSSIGEKNGADDVIYSDSLVFSYPSGFYDEEILVSIFAEEGAKIFYTLDGTMPSEESEQYTEPILVQNLSGSGNSIFNEASISLYSTSIQQSNVDKCTILKAIAVDKNGKKSEVVTSYYFITIGTRAVYNNIPIISIVADPNDLIGYFDGIYVTGQDYEDALIKDTVRYNSANYYREKSIDATLHYYEPESKGLSYAAEIKLSVRKDKNVDRAQKSLLVELPENEAVSAGTSLYSFADGQIVLNGGGSDYFYKVRQYLFSNVLSNSVCIGVHVQPCVVFLNGDFWGMYLLQNEICESTISEAYNLDVEDIVFAETSQDFVDLYQWVISNDMSENENYIKLKEQMDIQSYLEYLCTNIYVSNSNFSSTEGIIWKTNSIGNEACQDGKWRWINSNMEETAAATELNTFTINTFLSSDVQEDIFFRTLLKNKEFEGEFISMMDRMSTEYLIEEDISDLLGEFQSDYRNLIIKSAERFGFRMEDDDLSLALEDIKEFFMNRDEYISIYVPQFIEENRTWEYIPVETQ